MRISGKQLVIMMNIIVRKFAEMFDSLKKMAKYGIIFNNEYCSFSDSSLIIPYNILTYTRMYDLIGI